MTGISLLAAGVALGAGAPGCAAKGSAPADSASGGAIPGGAGPSLGGNSSDGGTPSGSGGSPAASSPGMIGAPLIFRPTETSFGINVVWVDSSPDRLRARVREAGSNAGWTDLGAAESRAGDLAEWTASGLTGGTDYSYEILELVEGSDPTVHFSGVATTQRPSGQSFKFALVTDTHIAPRKVLPGESYLYDYQEQTLWAISDDIGKEDNDFIINLGDMLDFHIYGFNEPPPLPDGTRAAYLNYRRLLKTPLGNAAHFPVIGNWDGENGDFTSDDIERARGQRKLYAPAPTSSTYPEGGADSEDYYAFTWGDALFVVLNVMSYTPTPHLLSSYPGKVEDWTLGDAQLAWLKTTLAEAKSPWRFLLIHHVVGGQAGTYEDSAYGRGGGQAAYVAAQAEIHQLMRDHGVQAFFYGHDHVFTDMVVDNIHYTLPGSAGAPWKFDSIYTGYETYWLDSGYGQVAVSPETVHVEFRKIGGDVLLAYDLNNPNP